MLVIFRGLPGTGKSHLVRRLLRSRPGFLVLSRDSIRACVVPHPTYAQDEKALVDEMIVLMTGFLLDRGRNIVIDGMALSSAKRVEEFARVAERRGVPVRIVECVCSETTALARIGRDTGGHPAGDRGEKLYYEVKERFEPVTRPALTLDTERDTGATMDALLRHVGGGEG